MPATECLCTSTNYPPTFALNDGRTVELRNGCLVDQLTRHSVTGSEQTTDFLLEHGELTKDQRRFWESFGPAICHAGAGSLWTATETKRKYQMGSLSGKAAND